jgi:hypothetical protein
MQHIAALEHRGEIRWHAEDHAWVADPEHVVQALTSDGYQEYRREIATGARDHTAAGGMWQGLDPRTGTVATVIWVRHAMPEESHVFIEIDGRPVEGDAWAQIDDAVLDVLADGGGRLTLGDLAAKVGMSESAVRSIVSMLAEQGKVRIAVVELTCSRRREVMRPAAEGTGAAPELSQ